MGTGGGSEGSDDNVVRLPRDWLGPREELIPFGPRAREAEEEPEQPAPDHRGPGATDPKDHPPLPTAEDFWGEHSAALQDVLQGPPATEGEGDPSPSSLVTPAAVSEPTKFARRLSSARSPLPVAAAAAVVLLALAATIAAVGSGGSRSGAARSAAGGELRVTSGMAAAARSIARHMQVTRRELAAWTPRLPVSHPRHLLAQAAAAPVPSPTAVVEYGDTALSSSSGAPVGAASTSGASSGSYTSPASSSTDETSATPPSTAAAASGSSAPSSPAAILGPGHCSC